MADLIQFPRTPWTRRAEQALTGAPENVLTTSLVILAFAVLVIALAGSPLTKAAAIAWVVLP